MFWKQNRDDKKIENLFSKSFKNIGENVSEQSRSILKHWWKHAKIFEIPRSIEISIQSLICFDLLGITGLFWSLWKRKRFGLFKSIF